MITLCSFVLCNISSVLSHYEAVRLCGKKMTCIRETNLLTRTILVNGTLSLLYWHICSSTTFSPCILSLFSTSLFACWQNLNSIILLSQLFTNSYLNLFIYLFIHLVHSSIQPGIDILLLTHLPVLNNFNFFVYEYPRCRPKAFILET